MDAKLRAKILDVLKRHHFMALATIRPDGYPQATTVNYVHDDLTIYFATDATSQKAGNIQLNDKVSVAIASETQDAYKLRGLSLSGTAKRVLDAERLQELRIKLFQKPFAPDQRPDHEPTPIYDMGVVTRRLCTS